MTSLEHVLLRRKREDYWLALIFILLLYWIVFGLGGVLGVGYYMGKNRIPALWNRIFLVASSMWGVVILATGWYLHVFTYWFILSLPLLVITSYTTNGLHWLYIHLLQPVPWNVTLRQQEQRVERQIERQIARHAGKQPHQADKLAWGLFVEGDMRTIQNTFHLHDQYLWFDEQILNQHLLIIGAPGSGKTEALKHLIGEILTKTNRDVFVVDGKGEEQFSQDIHALFQSKRSIDIPTFKMGTPTIGQTYNGFIGDAEAIKQRLLAMFRVEEQTGGAEFYAYVNRALINLACLSPQGPPRNLQELDQALSIGWLQYAYRGEVSKQKAIERYGSWFDGFRVRADALIWDFASYLSADGFTLDGTQGAIFSLRTAAMGDTTRRFFNFLIEDFKDWVGKRQTRPACIIVDEFGQLPSSEIVALLELARSANLGIILATQDLSTVRDKQVCDRLLSSIQTKILMKTDTPEQVGEMAGTRKTAHLTYQTDEIDMTGRGSIRLEDERQVDLNRVRKFPPGRAYLIRSGMSAIVQFRQTA